MSTIKCDIVTVERQVYSDEVDMVIAPGVMGTLGILPHHAPLITSLGTGELRLKKGETEEHFALSGGYMEVRPDRVIIMANTAERADEIDEARAEAARQRAIQLLREKPPDIDRAAIEGALRRSRVRLKVARKRRRRRTRPQERIEE
jgi:F-type H+-transporting ATPase subunit epsilon